MINEQGNKVVAGVDVAKHELVVRVSGCPKVHRFRNDTKGIRVCVQFFISRSVTLVVCEHTGRHEWGLLEALWSRGITVHCAHPKAIAYHAKARKCNGKSDPLDAETIMDYGLRMELEPTLPPSKELLALKALTARRDDLNCMLIEEKNRLTAPALSPALKRSIKAHIRYLTKALSDNAREIHDLLKQSPELKAPVECLDKEHGVGMLSAAALYGSMPELGTLSRQAAGALAGLAPFVRSSGRYVGQRKISGGRTQTRNALYMVALSVIRKKDHVLHAFYVRLKKNGKPPLVAISAVMRKLVIYFNSRLKELRSSHNNSITVSA
jgi:transposase